MPVPIGKYTFDNASYNTLWYLSISTVIEHSSFTSAFSILLKTCWRSTADAELPTNFDLSWTLEVRTK